MGYMLAGAGIMLVGIIIGSALGVNKAREAGNS